MSKGRASPNSGSTARLDVHVSPNARISAITGIRERTVHVRVARPPVDGAANEELIDIVSRALSVPRRDVRLVRGETARRKLLEVRGLDQDEAWRRVCAAVAR